MFNGVDEVLLVSKPLASYDYCCWITPSGRLSRIELSNIYHYSKIIRISNMIYSMRFEYVAVCRLSAHVFIEGSDSIVRHAAPMHFAVNQIKKNPPHSPIIKCVQCITACVNIQVFANLGPGWKPQVELMLACQNIV